MTVLITLLHILTAVILVTVILMQSGRGGGLTEGFASAESMFGAKTNAFMVKTTTVLTVIFIVTSLTLAFYSAQRDKSLMSGMAAPGRKMSTSPEKIKNSVKTTTPPSQPIQPATAKPQTTPATTVTPIAQPQAASTQKAPENANPTPQPAAAKP